MTLWERDWFLSLEGKYQLFVHYLRDHCDHAGVWQPAFKLFERMSGFRVDSKEFLKTVNTDSTRVVVLENGRWWLTGFIEDQYKTKELKDTVNPHKGVINSIGFNQIPYKSHGYTITLSKGSGRVKDQEQDQEGKEGSGGKGKFPEKVIRPAWMDNFEVYRKLAMQAAGALLKDDNWMKDRREFHPRLNIYATLKKAYKDYWGEKEGWQHMKDTHRKKKNGEYPAINWKRTYTNALTFKANRVWLTEDDDEGDVMA